MASYQLYPHFTATSATPSDSASGSRRFPGTTTDSRRSRHLTAGAFGAFQGAFTHETNSVPRPGLTSSRYRIAQSDAATWKIPPGQSRSTSSSDKRKASRAHVQGGKTRPGAIRSGANPPSVTHHGAIHASQQSSRSPSAIGDDHVAEGRIPPHPPPPPPTDTLTRRGVFIMAGASAAIGLQNPGGAFADVIPSLASLIPIKTAQSESDALSNVSDSITKVVERGGAGGGDLGGDGGAGADADVDLRITDKAFLDFSLCPTATRLDRTLGDMRLVCGDGEPMGRVVIGLYGRQVPRTVENFKMMITGKAGSMYEGSTIHKIVQGEYIMGGKQGGGRGVGGVEAPLSLPRNSESVVGKSFKLGHSRPGTVSLCLGENDEDEERKQSLDYRNVEFMITTGPGPVPRLDGENIVFGTVLSGMDVITAIASVPTFRPSENIRQFNEFAELLGDERASKGRNTWNRPLKAVVISGSGMIRKPAMPNGMP